MFPMGLDDEITAQAEVVRRLKDAAKKGDASKEQVDEALAKLLELKKQAGGSGEDEAAKAKAAAKAKQEADKLAARERKKAEKGEKGGNAEKVASTSSKPSSQQVTANGVATVHAFSGATAALAAAKIVAAKGLKVQVRPCRRKRVVSWVW